MTAEGPVVTGEVVALPRSLLELERRLSHRAELDVVAADLPRASVAALVREGASGGLELLFIRRADRDGDPWSGQMAWPGGRHAPTDPSALHTAQRETLEEIGVDLTRVGRPIARLDDVVPFTRATTPLLVTPFVFAVHGDVRCALNHEVAEVHWAALDPIARGEGREPYLFTRESFQMTFPSVRVGPHPVWGMTLRLLDDLLGELGAPRASHGGGALSGP